MRWKVFWALVSLIVLLAFSPMLGVIIAGSVAEVAGCQLDGSSVRPCIIAGADYGKMLYTLSLVGWLTIQTLPIAGLVLAGLVVVQAGLRLLHRQ